MLEQGPHAESKNYDKDVAITTWEEPGAEFNLQTTVDLWHESLNETIDNWKEDSKRRDFTINAIYLNKS